MRDNPVHFFFLSLMGQIQDQVGLGTWRIPMVALYWVMLTAGVAVAIYVWRRDPQQRTISHLSIFGLRYVAASMWYLGTLWKLPFPVSDGFRDWMTMTVKYSAFQIHSDFMQVFLDHISVVQPLVFMLELFFALSLMTGFLVRFTGIVSALFALNLLIGLYNHPTEWAWTYVAIICLNGMFAATQAGRSLGVDRLLATRTFPGIDNDRRIMAILRLAT